MAPDDIVPVEAVARRLLGSPGTPATAGTIGAGLARIAHLQRTDPGGAWVAEAGALLTGAALALVREGVWGLSLLIVHPDAQSNGTGSALLRAALDHGATVLSLELMRSRAEAETERRLRGDLVEELLGTPLSPGDAERLAERAARLGMIPASPDALRRLPADQSASGGALRRLWARGLGPIVAAAGS